MSTANARKTNTTGNDAKPTLHALAQQCLTRARGDWTKAAKALRKAVDKRPDLLEPIIERALWDTIRLESRHQRQAYRAQPKNFDKSGGVGSNGVVGIVAAVKRDWYEYPIYGGKRLGDCYAADLDEAAERHRELAEANATESMRMRCIRAALAREDKKVREQIDADRLREIAESVDANADSDDDGKGKD